MNRSKRSLNNKLSKKIQKEVRNAQAEYQRPEERAYSDQLTAREMLKKYPKKVAKKEKSLLDSMQKRVKLKKQVAKRISSKRTNSGEVPSTSSPAFVHKEGARWIKTLAKQSTVQRKRLQKKSLKKKT
ncbi:MAG: hypothetical protein JSR39_07745 [Verrucomicrobia bacterium]|nr:hypothetical protein [Verrucomicrobiota bacterium]